MTFAFPPDVKIFRVLPIGYFGLPEEERLARERRLQLLFALLGEEEFWIYAKRTQENYRHEDLIIPLTYREWFLISGYEFAEEALRQAGFNYVRVDELPMRKLVAVPSLNPKFVVLEEPGGGRVFARYFTITGFLPGTLADSWIPILLSFADDLRVYLRPYPPRALYRRLNKILHTIRVGAMEMVKSGKLGDMRLNELAERIQSVMTTIQTQSNRAFEFSIVGAVVGSSPEEVSDKFEALQRSFPGIEFSSPPAFQIEFYADPRSGTKYITELTTLGMLTPFVGNEVYDPGGVFLGIAVDGSPVIYNPWVHENYNMTILGMSGFGKSYSIKATIYRITKAIEESGERAMAYILDPEREYNVLAEALGWEVLDVTPQSPLRFDPFAIAELHEAVEIVAAMLRLSEENFAERKLKVELGNVAAKLKAERGEVTFVDIVDAVRSQDLRDLLDYYISGPYKGLFSPDARRVELPDKLVISLKSIVDEGIKMMVSAIAARLIWKKVSAEDVRAMKKMMVIDEGFILLRDRATANFIEQVFAQGRKRNLFSIFASQQAGQVLRHPQGAVIVGQSVTKLLLRADKADADVYIKHLNIEPEIFRDRLLTLNVGEGLLMVGDKRSFIRIIASESEHRLFTTKPEEWGAVS